MLKNDHTFSKLNIKNSLFGIAMMFHTHIRVVLGSILGRDTCTCYSSIFCNILFNISSENPREYFDLTTNADSFQILSDSSFINDPTILTLYKYCM